MATFSISLKEDQPGAANLVYILYLVSFFTMGLTALMGLVLAFLNKSKAPEWLKTHYDFLIGTFWKGLLFMVASMFLSIIYIGFLSALATVVWLIIRCIKGLKAVSNEQPIENPGSWLL